MVHYMKISLDADNFFINILRIFFFQETYFVIIPQIIKKTGDTIIQVCDKIVIVHKLSLPLVCKFSL